MGHASWPWGLDFSLDALRSGVLSSGKPPLSQLGVSVPLALGHLLNLQDELSLTRCGQGMSGVRLSLLWLGKIRVGLLPDITASASGSCLSRSFLWRCLRHFRAFPSSSRGLSFLQGKEGATDSASLAFIMVKEVFHKSQSRRSSPAEELTPVWALPDRLGL